MKTGRGFLLWWILTLLPGGGAAQEPVFPNTLEGVGCFENLNAPDYPVEAVEQKTDGFVWATIRMSAEGKIVSIDTDVISPANGAAAVLVPPVEKALRAAKVKPACYGKTTAIDFRYELTGDSFASPPDASSYLVTVRPKKAD